MGHVASSAPGASQMYVSVPIGSCGSWHPVVTHKPLWESPGTELSTWSIGSFCCIRAIQRTRLASRPLRSYTVLYSYTALYTIQLYIAIHYTTYATPLCVAHDGIPQSSNSKFPRKLVPPVAPPGTTLIPRGCRDRKTTGASAQGEDRERGVNSRTSQYSDSVYKPIPAAEDCCGRAASHECGGEH